MISLYVSDNRIRTTTTDSRLAKILVNTLAVHRSGNFHFSWPATPYVAAAQVEALRGEDVAFDDRWLYLYKQWEKIQAAGQIKSYPSELLDMPSSLTHSWNHQRKAYNFLREIPFGALFSDMRTGKTKVMVDLVCSLNLKNVLVVCPKSAMSVWPKEFGIHGVNNVEVILLTGKLEDRTNLLSNLWLQTNLSKIYVTNFEALTYPNIQRSILAKDFDMLIVDEAHRIKSNTGAISKFLAKVALNTPRRYALTGTPAADKPIDVFGIYRYLDPGIFGTTYSRFKHKYAIIVPRETKEGRWYEHIIGYQNQEELHSKMYEIAFRVTQDVLDLPPTLNVIRSVTLQQSCRDAYIEMEKESVLTIGKDDIMATNALTRYLRLQEISSGFTRVTKSNTIHRLGYEKSENLQELMEDIPDKDIVIFCRFTPDLDECHRIARILRRTSLELSGRREDLPQWQQQGGVLVAQIQAGQAGIDLSRADHVIYYSLGLSLTDYDQSKARPIKDGKKNNVTYYHLLAENTLDEKVYQLLLDKKEVVKHLVDGLRTHSHH